MKPSREVVVMVKSGLDSPQVSAGVGPVPARPGCPGREAMGGRALALRRPLHTGTRGDNGVMAPFQEAWPCGVSMGLSETPPVLGRDQKHEVA